MEISSEKDPAMHGKHALFSALGVGIGYLIVKDPTLNILPSLSLKSDENRFIESRQEAHTLELSLKEPAATFVGLDEIFHCEINRVLEDL